MNNKETQQLILKNREFLKHIEPDDLPDTDQVLRRPQPPLYKEKQADTQLFTLTKTFSGLAQRTDFLDIIESRRSDRIYTGEAISLEQLSYLLWVSQGVRGVRGNNYATIRNVPCGGARHEFECYLHVLNCTGLPAGLYHYLPEQHALELLAEIVDNPTLADAMMCGQSWVKKSSVNIFWSIIPYRAEWRYSVLAHRIALVDVGHVGENLYLAATALGLGTCGIGAYDQTICDETFRFDTNEEFTIYSATIGINR